MKKGFLIFVIVALLIVSVLGLTACSGFGFDFPKLKNDSTETPDENNKSEIDLPLVEEQKPENQAKISSVYDFSVSTLQFSGMIAPDYEIDDESTAEQLAEAYELYLEQLREYQIYLNEINTYYEGAQIEFYNDGTAVIKFANGDEQKYNYKNKSWLDLETNTMVRTVEMGGLTGLYGDGNLILYSSFDDNDLFVIYFEFVIAKANE